MTTFNFSTGNPANLTAGGGASMTDIQGPLNDVKSFLNGGSMDETNVPNVSAAFTTFKVIAWGGASIPTQGAGGTFLMTGGPTANAGGVGISAVGGAGTAGWEFRLDPSRYSANVRTTKLIIRWECHVNAVAPAQNFVPGLYPVSSFGGGSGVSPTIATIGTVVTGSTASFVTPGAGSYTATDSSEFTFPAVNPYCFGVVIGGGMTAGSQVIIKGELEMRQV